MQITHGFADLPAPGPKSVPNYPQAWLGYAVLTGEAREDREGDSLRCIPAFGSAEAGMKKIVGSEVVAGRPGGHPAFRKRFLANAFPEPDLK